MEIRRWQLGSRKAELKGRSARYCTGLMDWKDSSIVLSEQRHWRAKEEQ